MKQLAIRLSWQTTPAKSLVMFKPAVGRGGAPRQVELRSPACLRLIEGTRSTRKEYAGVVRG